MLNGVRQSGDWMQHRGVLIFKVYVPCKAWYNIIKERVAGSNKALGSYRGTLADLRPSPCTLTINHQHILKGVLP